MDASGCEQSITMRSSLNTRSNWQFPAYSTELYICSLQQETLEESHCSTTITLSIIHKLSLVFISKLIQHAEPTIFGSWADSCQQIKGKQGIASPISFSKQPLDIVELVVTQRLYTVTKEASSIHRLSLLSKEQTTCTGHSSESNSSFPFIISSR